jgi:hypothetical protein
VNSAGILLLLAAAAILAVAAVAILRLGGQSDPILDRSAKGRIQQRIAELDRSGARGPEPTARAAPAVRGAAASTARTSTSLPDPHRRLWRDTSAILVAFGIGLAAILAVSGVLGPQGSVLGETSEPEPDRVLATSDQSTTGGGSADEPAVVPLEAGGATPRQDSTQDLPSTSSRPLEATPTAVPSEPRTAEPASSSDRLAVLSECRDRPHCYVYVVRSGDNLVSIANWFGIGYEELLDWNPQVSDPSLVQPGDRITMPPPRR